MLDEDSLLGITVSSGALATVNPTARATTGFSPAPVIEIDGSPVSGAAKLGLIPSPFGDGSIAKVVVAVGTGLTAGSVVTIAGDVGSGFRGVTVGAGASTTVTITNAGTGYNVPYIVAAGDSKGIDAEVYPVISSAGALTAVEKASGSTGSGFATGDKLTVVQVLDSNISSIDYLDGTIRTEETVTAGALTQLSLIHI